MKNPTAVCAALALLLAPSVSTARWGMDFSASSWEMDGKEFTSSMNTYQTITISNFNRSMTGKLTRGRLGGAARLFVEGNSRLRLGAAAGYGTMPALSLKIRLSGSGWTNSPSIDLENSITYIPLDLYLKYTSEKGGFSLFGGGGAAYVMAGTDFRYSDTGGAGSVGTATFTQKKALPHVQAGCELFPAKWLSLNLSAEYLFSAVLDNLTGKFTQGGVDQGERRLIMQDIPPYGEIINSRAGPLPAGERPFKYDLSGLRVNFGLRIYFK